MSHSREAEVAALAALSDQDLITVFEKELDPESMDTEAERELMKRFFNLARKGAGMPTVAAYSDRPIPGN